MNDPKPNKMLLIALMACCGLCGVLFFHLQTAWENLRVMDNELVALKLTLAHTQQVATGKVKP